MQNDTPAVRLRKGDYVKFRLNSNWMYGTVADKKSSGKVRSIKCVNKKVMDIEILELFKSNKKEHEKALLESFIESTLDPEYAKKQKAKEHLVNPHHEKYTAHKGINTASGRVCYDISDQVADVLRGLGIDDVYEVVYNNLKEIMGEEAPSVDSLVEKYKHLNLGMQRMNLGNMLRGAMRKNGTKKLKWR